jgi:ABC-type transport system involved in multi-copper enzyme maturation permease subunit
MQTQPRFRLARRILFPYSGAEPLSRQQSLRVIVAWAVVFTLPMLLCTLFAGLLVAAPVGRVLVLLLIIALVGIVLFGVSAWFVVRMTNRSARLRQQDATRTGSTSGGRYGS